MFDSMIAPILMYGSEVWGYENLKVIEQIQLKFCKRILKVRNTTPHFMTFWSKLVLNENKLSSVLYRLMYLLKTKHQYSFKWLNHIESIFNSTGMGFIFINQFSVYDKNVFKQILRDQFVQKWLSDIYSSSRGQIYSVFKKDFCIENYLLR